MPSVLRTPQLRYAGQSPLGLLVCISPYRCLFRLLGLSTIGLDVLRIHRIKRHLDFLAEDDRLLLQDKPQLSKRELIEALEERGL